MPDFIQENHLRVNLIDPDKLVKVNDLQYSLFEILFQPLMGFCLMRFLELRNMIEQIPLHTLIWKSIL